jgi:hypothetical protein
MIYRQTDSLAQNPEQGLIAIVGLMPSFSAVMRRQRLFSTFACTADTRRVCCPQQITKDPFHPRMRGLAHKSAINNFSFDSSILLESFTPGDWRGCKSQSAALEDVLYGMKLKIAKQ